MVAPLTYTIDARKVEGLIEAFPETLGKGMRRAFDTTGQVYEDNMKREHFTGAGKDSFINPFKDKLRTRTGKLKQGIQYRLRGKTISQLGLSMISRGPSVFLHEFGGTIKPKRAKYLTIPTREAMTRGGAVKGGFRLTQRGGEHMTADGDPTFIIGDLGAKGTAGIYVDKGDNLIRIYTLKKQVEIPARLGFFREWRERVHGRLTREISKALSEAARGGK